jgi:hypothetical protein
LGSNGAGVVTINAHPFLGSGGGSAGSAGADGSSGTSGTSGTSATGFAGSNGTSGSSGTQGEAGTDGTHGTSGSSGTSGGGGTNGTGGSSGSSGTSIILNVESGVTPLSDIRYIELSNDFTLAQGATSQTASIGLAGGGSVTYSDIISSFIANDSGWPLNSYELVSSSNQILNLGVLTDSVPSGSIWIGGPGDTAITQSLQAVISAIGGGGGSGIFNLSQDTTYYTTTNYLEVIGGLTITSSIDVGSQSSNALTVTGSVDVLGSVSASALHVQSVGQPYLTSPTSINLQAESGSVNIISSSFRLASYSDAQTSSLIAVNGDMIYNITSNKFWGYANGAWVAFH